IGIFGSDHRVSQIPGDGRKRDPTPINGLVNPLFFPLRLALILKGRGLGSLGFQIAKIRDRENTIKGVEHKKEDKRKQDAAYDFHDLDRRLTSFAGSQNPKAQAWPIWHRCWKKHPDRSWPFAHTVSLSARYR